MHSSDFLLINQNKKNLDLVNVAKVAFEKGLAQVPRPIDLEGYVTESMFKPEYKTYV